MRAAVMEDVARPLVVRELRAADRGPHEVVVRLSASGVCHTDLHVVQVGLRVPVPAVLGHEGAGVVVRTGTAVRRVRAGDRVITSAAGACGSCFFCVRGEPQSCEQITTLAGTPQFVGDDDTRLQGFAGLGSFAEEMTVHESSVIPARTDLPVEQLALVGCGVVTGVGAVVNTAKAEPGMTVAVIGCGGVGQSAIQAAALSGAACVVAIDPVEAKRSAGRFDLESMVSKTIGLDDIVKAFADMRQGLVTRSVIVYG